MKAASKGNISGASKGNIGKKKVIQQKTLYNKTIIDNMIQFNEIIFKL